LSGALRTIELLELVLLGTAVLVLAGLSQAFGKRSLAFGTVLEAQGKSSAKFLGKATF
jgi:hypothetical protein